MHLFAAVVDTSAASIPYITLLQHLHTRNIESCLYITQENQHYIQQFDVPYIVDDFDLKAHIYGNQAVESGTSGLRMFISTRAIMSAYVPSMMVKIHQAVKSGKVNPSATRFLGNGMSLVYLGHFLLELGFKEFICVEPYRLIDWLGTWENETSQFIPGFLSQGFAARTLMSSQHGHTLAQKHFNDHIHYTYNDIKAAVVAHIHTYSPQLATDKAIALGYPYPTVEDGALDSTISDFIANAKANQRKVIAFTIGSMNLDADKKRHLIDEFAKGIVELGASGLILGSGDIYYDHCLSVNDFVPYTKLFREVDLVVTHGGAGTAHLALWAGTPVLSVPFIPDQHDWAKRLANINISAGVLPRERFNAQTFAKLVRDNHTPTLVEQAKRCGEIERRENGDSRRAVDAIAAIAQTPIQR